MQIIYIIIGYLLIAGTCNSSATNKYKIETDSVKHKLGDTWITLKKTKAAANVKDFYLQLHHNEETAEEAVLDFLPAYGGYFLNIINDNKRLITFKYNGEEYTIDPNRIFTKTGIDSTLYKLSNYNIEAAKEVEKFASFILQNIPDSVIIVAVHNNTDKNYSAEDYKKGGSLENDAEEVFLNPALDTDDFIFTTDKEIFNRLKAKELNVILQTTNATDDGSLSVYCAKTNRKYINIEAEAGHLKEQLYMLKAVKDILQK